MVRIEDKENAINKYLGFSSVDKHFIARL